MSFRVRAAAFTAAALLVSALPLAPSASAQQQSNLQTCRVLQDGSQPPVAGQSPTWLWYCDDSGRPTYKELGTDTAWGIVVPYPMPTGQFQAIAQSAHAYEGDPPNQTPVIIWMMYKAYGNGGYRWTSTGPNLWTAQWVEVDDPPMS
jgi:hypothetical protein